MQEKSDQERDGFGNNIRRKTKRKSWIWIVSLWGMSLPLIPLLYMQQTLYDIFCNYLVPHISKPRKKKKVTQFSESQGEPTFYFSSPLPLTEILLLLLKNHPIPSLFFFWHNLHINRTISHHLNLKGVINTHSQTIQYNTTHNMGELHSLAYTSSHHSSSLGWDFHNLGVLNADTMSLGNHFSFTYLAFFSTVFVL